MSHALTLNPSLNFAIHYADLAETFSPRWPAKLEYTPCLATGEPDGRSMQF